MPSPPSLSVMLSQLIAAPSVSSVNSAWDQSNEKVIRLLADWFAALGFKVEVLAVSELQGKYNLIASAGQGSEGLVLAGHTDTVPFNQALWASDPFSLVERDGRFYGLGVADMKGFFALVIESIRDLDMSKLKQPLTIIATADEESTMCGAKDLVTLGRHLGRFAVIGEPTGLRPIRMHKGIGMQSIKLLGRSGHSSQPDLGVNALEGMYQVIGEILKWRDTLQAKYHNPLFEVAVPTINLGHIHGGDNPNRICGDCELQIDMRPLPGMSLDALRSELGGRLDVLLEDSGLELQMNAIFEGIPPMETPATADIVKITEELTGQSAGSVAFGTEAPFFQQMGLESIVLGAGDIDQAHQPDEYMGLDRIQPMIDILQGLVKRKVL